MQEIHPENTKAIESLVALALEQADRESTIRHRMKEALEHHNEKEVLRLAKLWVFPDGFSADIVEIHGQRRRAG